MLKIQSPEIYKEILENLEVGVCLIDRAQKIAFWNGGAERITGFLKQEVLGRNHADRIFVPVSDSDAEAGDDAATQISHVLMDGKRIDVDAAIQHKTGHQVPVRLSACPIRDEQGMIIGAVESFDEGFESSERNRRESVLERHGMLDEVTGIARCGFVESQLREHLTMFDTYPIPFSILCIQIDGMDHWRTTLGIGAIPVILRAAAQTMEKCIRPSDSLGRCPDDKFLCILTECPHSHLLSVASRLRNSVRHDDIRWWGEKIAITLSIGGATATQGDTPGSIMERAARSLSESVKGGGNSFTAL